MTDEDRPKPPAVTKNRIHASDSVEAVVREAGIVIGTKVLENIIQKYRYESDLYKAFGPLVLIGIPREMTGRMHVINAVKDNLGKKAEVVIVNNEDELAAIARQKHLTAIFIDKSFTPRSVSTEKFRNDVYSIKLAKDYSVILTMNTISDKTRNEIKETIIALLGKLAAVDLDKAVQEFRKTPITPEKLAQMANIRLLVEKRRNEVRQVYNNMPMPQEAQLRQKPIAAATTEKVAMSDMYLGENMRIASDAGIKNVFLYGDELKTEEEARQFIIAVGYEGRMEEIMFIDKRGLAYEQVVAEVARQTGLTVENIGVRAAEGELSLANETADKVPGTLLEIQPIIINGQKIYVAMNSYQTLLKMLIAPEGELPPGVSQDEKIRGIFRYLPRAIPIDYEKEVRSYIEAIEVIRTAA